jgi:predicted metal-dependent hydrolase
MEPVKIDSIIRSKRKTVSLIITPEAKLVVRAPVRTSDAYIEKVVAEKRVWIQRKIAEIACRPAPAKKYYVDGEEFLFLGKKYPLKISDNGLQGIEHGEHLCVSLKQGQDIHATLTAWYKSQARNIFAERCASCAKIVGRTPFSIRISHATRRWGSCSTRGTLCFSWRLVLAPPEIIDYVIVHELVHLIHHNHSKRFWENVEAIMPDYRERKNWLKVHEQILTL